MLSFVRFFRTDCIVAPKDRSLAILVAVREREGANVWSAQVAAARRAGVREEAIDVIRQQGDPASLTPDERDIVIYTRQLVQQNRIDQAAFDALQSRHDVQWLVELTVAANYYALLCGVVNAFDIPAPPDGDKLP
jgi:4-carboxymuconolactone decarboxylase